MTPHFTLKEFTRSTTAATYNIDNSPSLSHQANLKRLAETMEKVRELLGSNPIIISSGYRSPALNKAVRGSAKSAHCKGLAVDFVCSKFGTPAEIFKALRNSDIEFDQLIEENVGGKQWIHFGLSETSNRMQTLLINDKGTFAV